MSTGLPGSVGWVQKSNCKMKTVLFIRNYKQNNYIRKDLLSRIHMYVTGPTHLSQGARHVVPGIVLSPCLIS